MRYAYKIPRRLRLLGMTREGRLVGMTRKILATIVALVTAASARAQNAGPRTIAGVVTDTAGIPLDSIDVSIASLRRRMTSDVNGRFRFDDVKPGTYDVSARHIGYAPQMHAVR